MKNGTVSTRIFTLLDEIARQYKITDGKWAEVGGLKYASRVAGLRHKAKLEAQGLDSKQAGRAFTAPKLAALIKGLQTLIGEEIVNKELLKRLKDAGTPLEKAITQALVLADDEEGLQQLLMIGDSIIKARPPREKKKPKAENLKK